MALNGTVDLGLVPADTFSGELSFSLCDALPGLVEPIWLLQHRFFHLEVLVSAEQETLMVFESLASHYRLLYM